MSVSFQPETWTATDGLCALVVDDDPIIRGIVRSVLTKAGYRVVLAASGNEALKRAPSLEPAVAIIDLSMPDGNGLQTCTALRRMPNWKDVPIIVLTSYPINQALQAALRAGANGFLCKPVVASELLQGIAAHITRMGMADRTSLVVESAALQLTTDVATLPQEMLPPIDSGWILK